MLMEQLGLLMETKLTDLMERQCHNMGTKRTGRMDLEALSVVAHTATKLTVTSN